MQCSSEDSYVKLETQNQLLPKTHNYASVKEMVHYALTMILEKPSHLGSAASLVWTVHQGLSPKFTGTCF
jgi:hypothetical protein